MRVTQRKYLSLGSSPVHRGYPRLMVTSFNNTHCELKYIYVWIYENGVKELDPTDPYFTLISVKL